MFYCHLKIEFKIGLNELDFKKIYYAQIIFNVSWVVYLFVSSSEKLKLIFKGGLMHLAWYYLENCWNLYWNWVTEWQTWYKTLQTSVAICRSWLLVTLAFSLSVAPGVGHHILKRKVKYWYFVLDNLHVLWLLFYSDMQCILIKD